MARLAVKFAGILLLEVPMTRRARSSPISQG